MLKRVLLGACLLVPTAITALTTNVVGWSFQTFVGWMRPSVPTLGQEVRVVVPDNVRVKELIITRAATGTNVELK
jgi:hypothetical protein